MRETPTPPDWPKWRSLGIVTLKEAVCLSVGLDPGWAVFDLGIDYATGQPKFPKIETEFNLRLEICERELHEFIPPVTMEKAREQSRFHLRDFVAFAEARRWELPLELHDLPDFTVKKSKKLSNEAVRLWGRKDLWALWEISFLLAGCEPDRAALNTAARAATRDDVWRAVRAGKLVPIDAAAIAEGLSDEMLFSPAEVIGWAADRFPDFPFSEVAGTARGLAPKAKPMMSTERTSLLLIAAGLADLAKVSLVNNSKTAVLIVQSLERLGVQIGQRTVEGHLKSVKEALDRRRR